MITASIRQQARTFLVWRWLKHHNNDLTCSELAELIGCHKTTVMAILKAHPSWTYTRSRSENYFDRGTLPVDSVMGMS